MVAQVRLERVLPYILKLLTDSQQHAVERACTIKVSSARAWAPPRVLLMPSNTAHPSHFMLLVPEFIRVWQRRL